MYLWSFKITLLLFFIFIQFNINMECTIIKRDSTNKEEEDRHEILIENMAKVYNTWLSMLLDPSELHKATSNISMTLENKYFNLLQSLNISKTVKKLADDSIDDETKDEILKSYKYLNSTEDIMKIAHSSDLTLSDKLHRIEDLFLKDSVNYIKLEDIEPCNGNKDDVMKGYKVAIDNYFNENNGQFVKTKLLLEGILKNPESNSLIILFIDAIPELEELFHKNGTSKKDKETQLFIEFYFSHSFINEKLNDLIHDSISKTEKDEILDELFEGDLTSIENVKKILHSTSITSLDKLHQMQEIIKTEKINSLEQNGSFDLADKCAKFNDIINESVLLALNKYLAEEGIGKNKASTY